MRRFAMRLEKLRQVLEAENLDGIIVTQPENRRYLSGFAGSDGTLFITQNRAILITDFRYVERSGREAPHFEVVKAIPDVLAKALSDLAAKAGAKRVGFESHHVSFAQYRHWAGAAHGFELIPLREVVEDIPHAYPWRRGGWL
jgi:Xaa-Pro aminopeptidase